jgi:hypothetical protein
MNADGLSDLETDAEHRIEAGDRVLQDDRDAAAANAPHLALRFREQVLAVETDRAADNPGVGLRHEPQDGQRRHRLAAA